MYFFCFFIDTKYMIWWVLGIYLVFFLLILPFRAKAKISYNLAKNEGKITVILAKLTIFQEDFELMYNAIVLKNKNGDKKTNFSKFGKSGFGDIFALNLIKSVKINTFKTDISLGLKDCCFLTSMVAGSILTFGGILTSIFGNKAYVVKNTVSPLYDESNLVVRFSSSVSLNLLIVIICLFNALFKIEKGAKIYGKQSS